MATINHLNKKTFSLSPQEMLNLNRRVNGKLTNARKAKLDKAHQEIKKIPELRFLG